MPDQEIRIETGDFRLLKPGEKAFSENFVWCALVVGQNLNTKDIFVAHATPPMMLDVFRPINVLPHVLAEHEPTIFNLMDFLLTSSTATSEIKSIKVTTVSRKDEFNSPEHTLTWGEFERVRGIVSLYDEAYLHNGPSWPESHKAAYCRDLVAKWDREKLNTVFVSPHHLSSINCRKFQATVINEPDGISLTVQNGDTEELLLQISHGILKQSSSNNE